MNGQGQLQCQQDPKDVTRVGSVKELPLCREKPIFHEPVGALIKDKEQLTETYPNSFDSCLIQDGKPIAFASKSLTGAESHYANIERELLAVVFACIRFNTYLQGCRFTVQSDHKPLEMIHLKSMHNAPPCLQRMLLQLQKYDMKIEYKPGSEMLLADALSRCPAR